MAHFFNGLFGDGEFTFRQALQRNCRIQNGSPEAEFYTPLVPGAGRFVDWLTIEKAGVRFRNLRRVICADSTRSWLIAKTRSHMLFDSQCL